MYWIVIILTNQQEYSYKKPTKIEKKKVGRTSDCNMRMRTWIFKQKVDINCDKKPVINSKPIRIRKETKRKTG